MQSLGKDPRLFSLRSIRQGATTIAEETNMPREFIRTSGGWKGKAMARYRKDRLPANQECFAKTLGLTTKKTKLKTPRAFRSRCPARHNRVGRGSRLSVRRSNRALSIPAARRLDLKEATVVNEGGKGLVKPEQNDVKLLKRSASLPEGNSTATRVSSRQASRVVAPGRRWGAY